MAWDRQIYGSVEGVGHLLVLFQCLVHCLYHGSTAVSDISQAESVDICQAHIAHLDAHLFAAKVVAANRSGDGLQLQIYGIAHLAHLYRNEVQAPFVCRRGAVEGKVEGLASLAFYQEVASLLLVFDVLVGVHQDVHLLRGFAMAHINLHGLAVITAFVGVFHHQRTVFGGGDVGRNQPVVSLIAATVTVEYLGRGAVGTELPCLFVVVAVYHCPLLELLFCVERGFPQGLCHTLQHCEGAYQHQSKFFLHK